VIPILFAIKAFLTSPIDNTQLQELKKASSLIEAPNIDKRPKIEDCQKLFENINDIKERNEAIAKAYLQGYSQHMTAKVLGLNQATVQRIIKRTEV